MLDFPKLLFQTVSLGVYMDSGFPLPLVVFYACPLAINWAISFYRFLRQAPDPILVITRVFYLYVCLQSSELSATLANSTG